MNKARKHVDALTELGPDLLGVEKPARYLGGEQGSISRQGVNDAGFIMALSFPDLYEIGMSNNAIRILYGELNARKGIRCERVFAPAPDFEALLAKKEIPLFTLESSLALCDLDVLGFSLGYELAATSVLSILSSGHIPLRREARGEDDPIVIMGGPAISNPHPFALFIDAAYIGEAEAGFYDLMEEIASMKAQGAGRKDLLARLEEDKAIWMPAASPERKTIRAVYSGFTAHAYHTAWPIATIKTIQDHGTVEIMRGCPNGCRFCHAGYYYRPQRLKPFSIIREEVAALVHEGGCREITLASLSSGDYPNIEGVLDALNAEWGKEGVSFQLPSLKVSSFTLPLIGKLSEVRKSGLTFAVETPNDAWQRLINKDVSFEQTVSILEEAKASGYKLAKFYFMIGLPVPGGVQAEVAAIIEFFDRLLARVPMQLNVNVGTFVPKPHTSFQWCKQLDEEEALLAIRLLKDGLKKYHSLKLSYHSPFVSVLEGLISRGDERVGEIILSAFSAGARLDAWDEHFNRDLWRSCIEAAPWKALKTILCAHELEDQLPWDDISIRVSKVYLKEEYRHSIDMATTSKCIEKCTSPCGSCGSTAGIVSNSEHIEVPAPVDRPHSNGESLAVSRLLFDYSKKGIAQYYPHLSISEAFFKAFQMCGIPVQYSEGFNPMPRLELIQPLPIGVESTAEYGTVQLKSRIANMAQNLDELASSINAHLPEGIKVGSMTEFAIVPGKKIDSLASLSWGSEYSIQSRSSSFSIQALKDSIAAKLEELKLSSASVGVSYNDNDSLRVRLPNPSTKDYGLMRILESCIAARPVQSVLMITREGCLAKSSQALGFTSYLNAFAELDGV